ncbi:MAG: AsmA family protein, partial [Candidatus Binataceae bacterium]
MRRYLIVGGAVLGALILIVLALLFYAASNLDSIIARNREYILTQASSALGRQVQVEQIKASVGWGVTMDLVGVKVGDDPRFSQRDFLTADDVYAKVEFLPLLASQLRANELVISKPNVRIIRAMDGALNAASIGGKSDKTSTPNRQELSQRGESARPSSLEMLSITKVTIDNGTIEYVDERRGGQPVVLRAIDLALRNLSVVSPIDVDLRMAALGETPNVKVSGTVGPVGSGGALNIGDAPLKLDISLGPAELAQLRTVPMAAAAIPADLKVTGPLEMDGKISGSVGAPRFHLDLDFTDNEIVYASTFTKPAGTTFAAVAEGGLDNSKLKVAHTNVKLGDADIVADDVTIGNHNLEATVKTNRFDIASLTTMLPALVGYGASGKLQIDARVNVADGKPSATGTVDLADVALARPGQSNKLVSELTGKVRLNGTAADVGPLNFKLGSSNATLSANVRSLSPLQSTYDFKADVLKLNELLSDRKDGETDQLRRFAARGSVALTDVGVRADTDASSASGSLSKIAYEALNLSA